MSTYYDEIMKRHARRKAASRNMGELKLPRVESEEAIKQHTQLIKSIRKEYEEACWLVERDVQILNAALFRLAEQLPATDERSVNERVFDSVRDAWNSVHMTAEEAEEYHAKQHAEREAEKKAKDDIEKSRGGVPGQMKMFKDDGTVAEEASPCETSFIGEENLAESLGDLPNDAPVAASEEDVTDTSSDDAGDDAPKPHSENIDASGVDDSTSPSDGLKTSDTVASAEVSSEEAESSSCESKVVDLMDTLAKSMESSKKSRKKNKEQTPETVANPELEEAFQSEVAG